MADESLDKIEELNKLAHGIAYDACCSVIESNCVMDAKAETDEFYDWYDVASAAGSDAEEAVAEAVKYLDARGLIDREAKRPSVISIRWESEAA
jgi:hypothetical protein